MKQNTRIALLAICFFLTACSGKTYNLADFGIKPDTRENVAPLFAEALNTIRQECGKYKQIRVILPPGRYDFHPEGAAVREYYISNHDQTNPKYVGLPFEGFKNMVFDGREAELIFHGQMLPVSLLHAENCTLKNFRIDFENPHISQVKILENDTAASCITYEVAPWVRYEIRDSSFFAQGKGWEHLPAWGIAFEENTGRVVYRTSDIRVGVKSVAEIAPRIIRSFQWKNPRLIPGTVVAMRSYRRPTPGIFITNSVNTNLTNIRIHYAEGMGVLAQVSENITLDGVSICLRGKEDPRYFTTQADATHFSGCKGRIVSKNGLYEGMMDDAINVHGTYLKVTGRIDDTTLTARYMHGQSYGFEWGRPGDPVQFVRSATMETAGKQNRIAALKAIDKQDYHGAREFRITFENPLDPEIGETGSFGIENLEWTPEVLFADNTIRNNRARGTLFSTPKPVIVENNLFDHTSGTAILLCGDCNGWYETGACREVTIRHNRFVNSLTNMFQFTNAIISIYPEIPDLQNQQAYFHSNITIEDNVFETFDNPIVYAKSVDGLTIRNNRIRRNSDYPSFHWNKKPFFFERVIRETIENNLFE